MKFKAFELKNHASLFFAFENECLTLAFQTQSDDEYFPFVRISAGEVTAKTDWSLLSSNLTGLGDRESTFKYGDVEIQIKESQDEIAIYYEDTYILAITINGIIVAPNDGLATETLIDELKNTDLRTFLQKEYGFEIARRFQLSYFGDSNPTDGAYYDPESRGIVLVENDEWTNEFVVTTGYIRQGDDIEDQIMYRHIDQDAVNGVVRFEKDDICALAEYVDDALKLLSPKATT